jgi:hypothetical protein
LGLAAYIVFRRFLGIPSRIIFYVAGRSSTAGRLGRAGQSSPMVSLFVQDQSTRIGKRNIHALKPGNTYTLGGGNSDFLIFLAPVPRNIALLKVGEQGCTLIPKKRRYFPDGAEPVEDCVGKTIRILTDSKYELFIKFVPWEDPLKRLNRTLTAL